MQGKRKFLLESSSKHEGSGRYSFIGMDPLKSYSGRDGKIEEHVYETGKKYSHEGDLFVLLKRLMPRFLTISIFRSQAEQLGMSDMGQRETAPIVKKTISDFPMSISIFTKRSSFSTMC